MRTGQAKLVRVFVVKADVEKILGGDQALADGLIKSDAIPEKFRPGSALTDKDVIEGKVALTRLSAGQVLVDGMFVDPACCAGDRGQAHPRRPGGGDHLR